MEIGTGDDDDGFSVDTFGDILAISEGVDEVTGLPNATAIVTFDELTDDEGHFNTIKNAPMDCTFEFFCEGGAVAMECTFDDEHAYEIDMVFETCDSYINRVAGETERRYILSLIMVPSMLGGALTVSFTNITYYTQLGPDRILFVFDNTQTDVIGMDMGEVNKIKRDIDAEFLREERELEDEIYAAKLELEEAKKYNPFAEEIMAEFTNTGLDDAEDDGEDGEDEDDEEDYY